MAWMNEKSADGAVNVETTVGAEIRNVVRRGHEVYFEYRAFICQSGNKYSYNTWALWVEGNRNVVKGAGSRSSQGYRYYTGWYGRTISLDPGSSYSNVSIGVAGNNHAASDPAGYVYIDIYELPTAQPPSLSNLSINTVSDKNVRLSFNINNDNNAPVTDSYIDLSYTNFGKVIAVISDRKGGFINLIPNRIYYVRGNAANAAGRTFTNVASFKTNFINPGDPQSPLIGVMGNEIVPNAVVHAKWFAAKDGSTPIAGYRIRLYKNNKEVLMVDTENNSTEYTFKSLDEYGFVPGDKVKMGIYSYSKDWHGYQFFNGDGVSSSEIFSNELEVISDKFIYASVNGKDFEKYKMYISYNGEDFKEIKKEKFNILN